MALTKEALRQIPLFEPMGEPHLEQIAALFERRDLDEGERLFSAGDPADALSVLTRGEIGLHEGDQVRFRLKPVAAIGELGAVLTDLHRNTTAQALVPSEVWQVGRDRLRAFLREHPDVAVPFYDSMLHIAGRKIHRDQMRLEDMRRNIVRTQKALKRMRDLILETVETPLSEPLHETIEELIRNNRRVNYRVEPPRALPAFARLDDGRRLDIVEMSRTHFVLRRADGVAVQPGERFGAVLHMERSGREIPLAGTVVACDDDTFEIELDLLIDEYGAVLDDYLTRVQMLDFLV